jgi:CPA1 family monovalent cation:H+ antiporter
MDQFDIVAGVIVLAAGFAFVNARFLRLQPSIGVMVLALAGSAVVIVAGQLIDPHIHEQAERLLGQVRFSQALLRWMLGFLLFAGALHVDLDELRRQGGVTFALASFATILSTFLIGGLMWLAFRQADMEVAVLPCLAFGALISPTDPVSVVAVMRRMHTTRQTQTILSAESLFNDGVGVVLFLTIVGLMNQGGRISVGSTAWLLIRQTGGGLALGFAMGVLVYVLLRQVQEFEVEVLLTLALVMGGYALADALGCSGPIAMVVAGLLIGNQGRLFHMDPRPRADLLRFWDLIDEILNTVLFLLIGLEVLAIRFGLPIGLVAAAAVLVTLASRWISVWVTLSLLGARRRFGEKIVAVLTWGGLRGGLAVAMALSLPEGEYRERIVAITWTVAVFSVLVQGTTMGRLLAVIEQ